MERRRFDDLDTAVEAAQRSAEEIRDEGTLEKVSMLRDFDPAVQVKARLEISGPGWLHPPTAGVDLRGDGSLVAYSGSVRRTELPLKRRESPFDAVRRTLRSA